MAWSLFDEILAVTAPAEARKLGGGGGLLGEPVPHSGYCESLHHTAAIAWHLAATSCGPDTPSIHRPSPEPTPPYHCVFVVFGKVVGSVKVRFISILSMIDDSLFVLDAVSLRPL